MLKPTQGNELTKILSLITTGIAVLIMGFWLFLNPQELRAASIMGISLIIIAGLAVFIGLEWLRLYLSANKTKRNE